MYKCQQQDPLKSRGRKASESRGDVVRGSPPVLSGLRDAGRAPMSQGAKERQEHCHPHLLEKSTLVNSVLFSPSKSGSDFRYHMGKALDTVNWATAAAWWELCLLSECPSVVKGPYVTVKLFPLDPKLRHQGLLHTVL